MPEQLVGKRFEKIIHVRVSEEAFEELLKIAESTTPKRTISEIVRDYVEEIIRKK
jgi:predicted DNA-binding protein